MFTQTSQAAETSILIEDDYEQLKTDEVMNKPQIKRILEIVDLDMHLLDLVKLNISMLKIESNQEQLKQLVQLIKLNIKLLRYEPALIQSVSNLLKELDGLPLFESHLAQANSQNNPPKKLKEIYGLLEKVKAYAGQVAFDPNLIAVQNLIQRYQEEFQAEHQLNQAGSNAYQCKLNHDLVEHIVNLLEVRLIPDSTKSNLNLVKRNLELMNQSLILLKQESKFPNLESNRNPIDWKDKLIDMISGLNERISVVDCVPPEFQDDSTSMDMNFHATRFIRGEYGPKPQLYIDKKDSSKDAWDQLVAMYKQPQTKKEKNRSTRQNGRKIEENYTWCESFLKAIYNDNWEAIEKFLKECPSAMTAKITVDWNTALHVAVKAGKLAIVRKLLEELKKEKKHVETLKKENKEGKTALYIAASGGFTTIARKLVEMNEDTLLIECEKEAIPLLPLFVAAKYDNKEMTKYLYGEMKKYRDKKNMVILPKEDNQNDQKGRLSVRKWASFLATLIYNHDYDLAKEIVCECPSLALTRYKDMETPLFALAQTPFLGANKTIHDTASKSSFIPFTVGNKIDRGTALNASDLLDQIILTIDDLQSQKPALSAALFKAVEVGSVDFVTKIINSLPLVLSWLNDLYQSIFHVAIIHRQENIFNLIHGLGPIKNDLTHLADKSNNWMLHLAGKLAPQYQLNQVHGAALQLQRELQWFEAVREIVPNISTDIKNLGNQTAYEIFATEHSELMKDGQKWMKNTAASCSIVATLTATVVFAAAFTVPGGNNIYTGDPMFLQETSFLLFTISNAAALFTSCASVLMFLAIITSSRAQHDFLISLPKKLIFGLLLLFISIVQMVFAFGITIYITIQKRYNWVYIPILVGGLIPVGTYLRLIFTLSIDLYLATYSSIFNKRTENLYY